MTDDDALAPGYLAGEDCRLAGLIGPVERAGASLPMGRLGQAGEIAGFVVFLLSGRSGVVTGSVIDWDQNVPAGMDLPVRLGLLGLGRIGAFHAQTLASLPVVDSLVVSDPVPSRAADAAERFGAEVAGSRRPCSPRGWTVRSSRRPPAPTRT